MKAEQASEYVYSIVPADEILRKKEGRGPRDWCYVRMTRYGARDDVRFVKEPGTALPRRFTKDDADRFVKAMFGRVLDIPQSADGESHLTVCLATRPVSSDKRIELIVNQYLFADRGVQSSVYGMITVEDAKTLIAMLTDQIARAERT